MSCKPGYEDVTSNYNPFLFSLQTAAGIRRRARELHLRFRSRSNIQACVVRLVQFKPDPLTARMQSCKHEQRKKGNSENERRFPGDSDAAAGRPASFSPPRRPTWTLLLLLRPVGLGAGTGRARYGPGACVSSERQHPGQITLE